jgi:hypothetical protein
MKVNNSWSNNPTYKTKFCESGNVGKVLLTSKSLNINSFLSYLNLKYFFNPGVQSK